MSPLSLTRLPRALFLPVILLSLNLPAQTIEPTTGIALPVAGKLRPRAATEIKASNWSVGGETLDRDFADYHQYKKFLGPLGAKAIRLQVGWAKTERERGRYDFAWLDAIVDDALAQGVQPWLGLCYGNPLYEGGGGITLAAGLPSSLAALEAWDAWTRATVKHYRDRVRAWEIWNEPDLSGKTTAGEYTALFIRTAEIIRAEQPDGQVYALALAGNPGFATSFLSSLHDQKKLGLVDAITVHGYPTNPSETASFDRWRTLVGKFFDKIQIRQGETGAPSFRVSQFALKNQDWTETLQAKWDLCRLLTHLAHDMPMNLFTLCDLHYVGTLHNGPNPKGLLKANPDKTVAYSKPAYFAAQNVFSVFDANWKSAPALRIDVAGPSASTRILCYGLVRSDTDAACVVLWFGGATPSGDNAVAPVDITVANARFKEPVCVDLRTGVAYSIPEKNWKQNATGATFTAIPVYDSPVLIVEKTALTLAD